MAIDYGRKRVGLAVTDEQQIIATGLATVAMDKVFTYLDEYLLKHTVECIVIGQPMQMDNTPSESAAITDAFSRKLKKRFPNLKIERMDERFTSRMASRAILDAGARKSVRQDKALVDMVSAIILLQSYMESLTMKKMRGLDT